MLDLSIVLITYNRAPLLRKTLEAVSRSAFADAELVVLNNASEDDTEEVVREYLPRFNEARLITHPFNIGGNANILRAYEYGRRFYTWILCDDDQLDFDNQQDLLAAIEQKKAEIIRVSDVGVVQEERGSTRSLAALLHDRDSLSFYSLGFVPGLIFRSDRVRSNVQYGYRNLHTHYSQLFVLMKSFSMGTLVYTTGCALLSRGPGIMSIGSEILSYQILSLAALPTKRAKWVALRWRRKHQRLRGYLFGYSYLLLSDFRLRRKRSQMARTWLKTIFLSPSLLGKLIIGFNGLFMLLPVEFIARRRGKELYLNSVEVEKRGVF